jgi:putative ABC transport system permease protein
MNSLRRDLALAFRSLRRRPAFVAVVALTLGLGIGANTAVFGVVNAVLLRPLPYPAPEKLVVVWGELPGQGRLDSHLSGPELAAIWEGARSLGTMGAVWARPGVLRGNDGPAEEVEIGWVTPGFLEALGVAPHLGRLPTREEQVADPSTVMVLSFELWQRRYGGDSGILGRVIDFDDERRTIVGVMPRGFRMFFPPDQGVPENLTAWLPWGGSDYRAMSRGFRVFTPVVRLAPGVTPGQAAAEMRTLAARVKEESVEYGRSGFGLRIEPLGEGVVARVRPTLLVLLGVALLVLLVACANAANLTLARAAETERDLRVRAALGAGRGSLFRQMLTESAVLGGLGAGVGLLFAEAGLRLVRVLEPGGIPRVEEVSLDPRTLLCAAATALAASLLFGGIAAWQTLRVLWSAPLQDGVRAGAPGSARARGLLVVSELALSLVLLAGAGLLVRSFVHRRGIDPGFDPRKILTLVVGQGMAFAGAGVAAGLALALAFTRVLSSLLYGVAPHDPLTLGSVALLLAGIALLACWAPARRASRIEAAEVLRNA